jgi:hypothetical protein
MDNRTVQRARQGDEEARRLLEAHLRNAARQLLAYSSLRVDDPVTQRVLANAAVAEALEREHNVLDTLMAAVVMAAARRGVEHLRRLHGAERGAGHLPPGILVSVALVPQILASASRAAAEEHLSSCADCTEQARSVRDAAASATLEDDDPEENTAQHHIDAAFERTRQVAQLPPGAPEAAQLDSTDAAEAMLQRLLQTADAVDAAREAGPARRRRRRRRGRQREKPLRALPLVLLGGALGLLVWKMDFGCAREAPPPPRTPAIAAFARTELPPLPREEEWSEPARSAFLELRVGDCAMAENRFRLARKRQPELAQAWHWEGLSALCAGHAEAATTALAQAEVLSPELVDLRWHQAQAALLAGRFDEAERRLAALCSGGRSRAVEACAQLASSSAVER